MTTETSRKRKRVVILGATGSIGESALKVARDIPERMEIVGLAAKGNAEKLAVAANETHAQSGLQAADFHGRRGIARDRLPDECRDGAGRNRWYRRITPDAGSH